MMGDDARTVAWLESARASWDAAFSSALHDAILHLQVLIFDEGWDELVAFAGSPEAALRESVTHYERGLADLFSFVRASGSLPDAVGWSTLKVAERRAALESGVEITLRTALETGLYVADRTPLGDHTCYVAWTRGLIFFLTSLAASDTGYPEAGAQEERLDWAYAILVTLEDHETFHRAFADFLHGLDVKTTVSVLAGKFVDAAIDHEARLLHHPRFDLLLNTALLWLADTGGRWLEYLREEE